MANLSIAPAQPSQAPELGRICYEAFQDISDRHGFPTDFPSVEFARMILGMLIGSEDYYSIAALQDGRPVGSNYLSIRDEVGGVGPVSVDVQAQGNGVGRMLMEDVLNYARQNGMERVRLMQDSFNMASLSLYASLGFDTKEPVALMVPRAAAHPDESVRPLSPDDLPAIEELSRDIYKVSRRDAVAAAPQMGITPLVKESRGRLAGYLVPGIIGHGVAQTEEEMLALIGEAARRSAPREVEVFCPLTEGSLFRKLIAAGSRVVKAMNLMAYGPYEAPDGVWLPSVAY